MVNRSLPILMLPGLALLAFTGCWEGHEPAKPVPSPSQPASEKPPTPQEPAAKAYPLKTCIVSGKALGSMGEPKRIVVEGQEIKFCCGGCEKDFRKDTAKFLKVIEEGRQGR